MPAATSNGRPAGSDAVSNQRFAQPRPDHLRDLVLNYLGHNCYLKTAEAFAKDSAVRYLDQDGDRIWNDRVSAGMGNRQGSTQPQASSTNGDLSDEMVRHILLRQRIQFEILSGNVEEATVLLNHYFPRVLAQDGDEAPDETEVADEDASAARLEYVAETVDPVHLSLNLRILAFIEACRTVPLPYVPLSRSTTVSPDSDTVMSAAPAVKRDAKDEENHQAELLICAQKLYATVNALTKPDDRAIYLDELRNVGGILAYTVPETSPMVKYLRQERRDRVAEQINSAILYHTGMPSVPYLERAVRYTHCLWAMLHELRVKVPAAHRPRGISLLLGPQGSGESEKEAYHEARPFDLQLLLNTRT